MSRGKSPEISKLGHSFLAILLELTSDIKKATNTPDLIERTYKAASFISSDILQTLKLTQDEIDTVARYHSLNAAIQNPILYNDTNMAEVSVPTWARTEDTGRLSDCYKLIDEISSRVSERPEIKKRLEDIARIRSRIEAHHEAVKFPWLYGPGSSSPEEPSTMTKPRYSYNEPAKTHLGKLSRDFDHTLLEEELKLLEEEEKECERYLREKSLEAAEAIESKEEESYAKMAFFISPDRRPRYAGFDRSFSRIYFSIPRFTKFINSFYSNAEKDVEAIAKKLMEFHRITSTERTPTPTG